VQPAVPGEKALDRGDDNAALLDKAKSYLSSTLDHLREGLVAPAVADLKLTLTWSVAVESDVASALIRLAENGEDAEGSGVFGGCDLIVMATHGSGGFQRWAMGSITERVLHATRLPLLIIRPQDLMEKSNVAWDRLALSAI
jgi:nucleotide-binding universal stress UspA family protein